MSTQQPSHATASTPAPASQRTLTLPEQRSDALRRFCLQHPATLMPPRISTVLLEMPGHAQRASVLWWILNHMCYTMLPHLDKPGFPLWFLALAYRCHIRSSPSDGTPEAVIRPAPLLDPSAFVGACEDLLREVPNPDLFDTIEFLSRKYFEHDDCFHQSAAAFTRPYLDRAHERFDREIAKTYAPMFEANRACGRAVPVVQSSGVGKSRMVHELRHLWPTIILTLSEQANTPSIGYPVAEAGTVDFFTNSCRKFGSPELAFLAFFVAWFKKVASVLRTTCAPTSMGDIFAPWAPIEDDLGVNKEIREAFFAEVYTYAETLRLLEPDFQKKASREVSEDFYRTIIMSHLFPLINQLAHAIQGLEPVKAKRAKLDRAGKSRPTVVYVGIDGYRLLDSMHPRSDASRRLSRVLKLISEFVYGDEDEVQFWFLLIGPDLQAAEETRRVSWA
ncbi:uncharacterized protein PSFLO_00022 [Pseudozyma flocculosa]|uniref:Uncharacterized protein n=1 Tax=Pseudozyma flocculosa TaxID=84751 RepID=A0A5C3EU63_9BASI|nr:uncharacterized protein PSFLO_00022 [Pseudozyma flocculosa]